jgi:hypothetical protein
MKHMQHTYKIYKIYSCNMCSSTCYHPMKIDAGVGEHNARHEAGPAWGAGARGAKRVRREARRATRGSSVPMETSIFFLIMGRSDLVRRPTLNREHYHFIYYYQKCPCVATGKMLHNFLCFVLFIKFESYNLFFDGIQNISKCWH